MKFAMIIVNNNNLQEKILGVQGSNQFTCHFFLRSDLSYNKISNVPKDLLCCVRKLKYL